MWREQFTRASFLIGLLIGQSLKQGDYSAFQTSVQDCDITDDWPLTADHRVKMNNERLAQSACVFFLSRQLSVICRQ